MSSTKPPERKFMLIDQMMKIVEETRANNPDYRQPPIIQSPPKDLRPKFLSHINYCLLQSIIQFASDYVQGRLRVNNLSQMNCTDLKQEEIVEKVTCNECLKQFRRETNFSLFCLIDNSIDIEDELKRHKKFKFICAKCHDLFQYKRQFDLFQIYPYVILEEAEILCQLGFFKCYLFNINLEYTCTTEETSVVGRHDFFGTIKELVDKKKPNEQITKILLRTYGRTLFTETDRHCIIKTTSSKIGCDDNTFKLYFGDSKMMDFFATRGEQKLLTYFYSVEKKIYKSTFNFVLYFPVPCKRFCVLCTRHKMYLKKHIVLYCSQCGFTDAMFFTKNKLDVSAIKFHSVCVKVKTIKPKRIYYYDMNLYKKICA
uniref:Me53 n=1 Tax=Trichoplusia ni single nucleopolyhedrovirus TaxID=332054 RepID=A0A481V8R1_9ABAC|nr:me53 [Trichoplusia ni single nucleopolyhedrovirus]